jgi:hypothetical protein
VPDPSFCAVVGLEPADRVLAAIFNVGHRAHYVHWHFFRMSVANIVVIVLMILVFWLAILIPFPRRGPER